MEGPDNSLYEGTDMANPVGYGASKGGLLALPRALAADPRILVLEEATSSGDTETERHIQEAMKELIRGRTSIVIAHRLSTLKQVDKILVLRNGEIAEFGTQQELIRKKGVYQKLYSLQAENSRVS